MKRKFLPGYAVCQVIGGPAMTVDGYDDHGRVVRAWFNGPVRHSDAFDEGALAVASVPHPP